jgi:uncharacterized protein (DUF433 family)
VSEQYDHLDVDRDRPRLAGERLGVIEVHDMVESLGSVEEVASEWDVDVEAVREAVEYYRQHEDELEAVRERDRRDGEVARELQADGEI